jgi:Mg2+/Co2+ transporter CorB
LSEIPLSILFLALVVLLIFSAFFSGSETGLMAINRYRLRHRAQSGDKAAVRVSRLLARPDRLIGLILLGNNFVNILASSIATFIGIRLLGEAIGLPAAAIVLTFVLLIFSEVTPKTLAALHPERFAYPASWLLTPMLRFCYPLVWMVNAVVNVILKLLGISGDTSTSQPLSAAELRTVVLESGGMMPRRHRDMLLSILDLEAATVEDIMIPRYEVEGVDLDSDWNTILEQIRRSQYTRLPVYRGDIEQIIGLLHLRSVVGHLNRADFTRADLEQLIEEPYFIPEGTPLHTQLLNFQKQQKRIGLVVYEYGDLLGLVTLEDILEEIVGEFTTDPMALARKHITPQDDGAYLVDGSTPVRLLNRSLDWNLPTAGPKTLNGLIMEYLEAIPEPGTSLLLSNHPVEIVKISGNRVKTVLIRPPFKKPQPPGAQE